MQKFIGLLIAALCVNACAAGAAQSIELRPAVAELYKSVSVPPPSSSQMTVCYGYVCRLRYIFDFTPQDRAALTRIMSAGRANAAGERTAVQEAVVWWDKRLGPLLGTSKREARADFRAANPRANFDCWDTTRNVTGLLAVLQDWGLLKFHTVDDPKYRGNFLVLQTPHNTPVLREKANGSQWVVDMWTVGFAQKPQVMTVEDWMPLD